MVTVGDGSDVGASELVSLVDGVCVPLRPVHKVREHGDALFRIFTEVIVRCTL